METFLAWLLPMLVGVLVASAILQLLYAWALSAIVEKLGESELMQVLAWIPLLQIAPVIAAGGGSLGGFFLGLLGLLLGSVALGIASSVVGGTLGGLLGVVAIVGGGGLGVAYMVWLLWNTAVRRELPGWIGLLSFVPLVNLFVYPYIAFHDGWSPPHRIGVVVGLVLTVASTAPSVQAIRTLQQSGGLAQAMAAGMAQGEASELDPEQAAAFEAMLSGALGEAFDAASPAPTIRENAPRDGSPGSGSDLATPTTAAVKALFDLGERFDALTPLFAEERLARPNGPARAREALRTARNDLDARRPLIGEETWASLTTQLDELSARLDGGSNPNASARIPGRLAATPHDRAPASGSAPAAAPAFTERDAPPRRPFPVRPAADCPAGTRLVSRADDEGDEEWCQQDAESGGLRHGWYVRYWPNGRPESTGEYRDGLRVGIWTRFHESGDVRAQAQFERGLQHGWLLTFDETGERERAVRYEEGVAVR